MKTIEHVKAQLLLGEFEFSRHALRRVVERNISELEIRQSGSESAIIEEYPDDKYAPSCLLHGFTAEGRPLHIQVSLAETDLVRIITVYEPDPLRWSSFSVRR